MVMIEIPIQINELPSEKKMKFRILVGKKMIWMLIVKYHWCICERCFTQFDYILWVGKQKKRIIAFKEEEENEDVT